MAYNSSRNTNYAIRNMSETNGGFMLSTHTILKKYYKIPVQEIIELIFLIRFSKPDQADNFRFVNLVLNWVFKSKFDSSQRKMHKRVNYGDCTTVNGWTNKESKHSTLPSSE